jgi:hypothetical protein
MTHTSRKPPAGSADDRWRPLPYGGWCEPACTQWGSAHYWGCLPLTLRWVGACRAGLWRNRFGWAVGAASVLAVSVAGCGSGNSAAANAANQTFLSQVHVTAPDINTYRTDVQLTRIGHAACDGFRSGASYQELADRLPLLEGSDPLPSADLGAVIDAAVNAYCGQYRSQVQ